MSIGESYGFYGRSPFADRSFDRQPTAVIVSFSGSAQTCSPTLACQVFEPRDGNEGQPKDTVG
ncbi:hypothetical protein [Baaleninema simplex]|uniref:hypothetical protein n=1 Tax=Baaleninema simplex TaxID=2862350 RepID=UPI0011818908|nr:hypothetical protein [Baaleninema simplex]